MFCLLFVFLYFFFVYFYFLFFIFLLSGSFFHLISFFSNVRLLFIHLIIHKIISWKFDKTFWTFNFYFLTVFIVLWISSAMKPKRFVSISRSISFFFQILIDLIISYSKFGKNEKWKSKFGSWQRDQYFFFWRQIFENKSEKKNKQAKFQTHNQLIVQLHNWFISNSIMYFLKDLFDWFSIELFSSKWFAFLTSIMFLIFTKNCSKNQEEQK